MPFSKICPICNEVFICKKVNTIYCSKKCRNRGRTLPEEMKVNLIKRSNQYVMKANNLVAEIPNNHGGVSAIGYTPKKSSQEHPLGTDEGLLLAQALLLKEQRDRDERNKQRSIESESGFGSTTVDPEMLAMMHTVKEEEIPILSDTITGIPINKITADITGNEPIILGIERPKKYKIKKFGS